MGRKTYETVLGFGGQWPYNKPVFVLSNTLSSLPGHLQDEVELVRGSIRQVVEQINSRGLEQLYIDGGELIQNFLQEDMIDEMIITQIPICSAEVLLCLGICQLTPRLSLFAQKRYSMQWSNPITSESGKTITE